MIVTTVPWDISAADKQFQKAVTYSLLAGLLSSVAISLIDLPDSKPEQFERKVRMAEIVLPVPEPIMPPVIERPKVEPPKPKPLEAKPEVKPEPAKAIVAEAPQTVKQAKEKARVSGLLAFQDQLQAMRDEVADSALSDTSALVRGSGQAAELQRAILTSNGPGAKKARVNTSALSRETGGIALSGRETTVVEAVAEDVATTGAVRMIAPDVSAVRSIEEIRRVFDANKGAIFSIYNRALRKDPTLLGKVVLELVIEPDGTVSTCQVLNSEIESEELINRVVRRVQLFDFGAKQVATTRISYPVHFLPT